MNESKKLLIEVDATIALAQQKLRTLERTVDQSTTSMQRDLDKVDSGFGRMNASTSKLVGGFKLAAGAGAGFIASIGVDTIVRATTAALEFSASLGETSQKLGVSAELMQKFRFAVEQNGGSTEDADRALGKFSERVGAALRGNKAAEKSFAVLGISIEQLKAATEAERLFLFADAIAKISDAQERAAARASILGKAGREVGAALDNGSAGLKKYGDEAVRIGRVVSDDAITKADLLSDKIDGLRKSLEGQFAQKVGENADSLLELIERIEQLTTAIFNFEKAYPRFAKTLQGFAAGGPIGAIYSAVTGEAAPAPKPTPFKPLPKPLSRTPASLFNPTGTGPLKGGFAGPLSFGGASVLASLDFAQLIAATGASAEAAAPQFREAAELAERLSQTLIDGETLDSRLRSFGRTQVGDGEGPQDDFGLGDLLDAQNDKLGDFFDAYERRGEAATRLLAFNFETLMNGGVDDVLGNFKRIGVQIIAEMAARLAASAILGTPINGGIGGLFSSALGSILGFANGGEPPVGRVSLVGERGPELFVPKVPGTVIANDRLGGLGGVTNHFDLRGAMVTEQVYADMQRIAADTVRSAAPRIVGAAKGVTDRGLRRGKLSYA